MELYNYSFQFAILYIMYSLDANSWNLIDLFSLYVLLPHFRPRDGTLENHCFQILKYLRAYE